MSRIYLPVPDGTIAKYELADVPFGTSVFRLSANYGLKSAATCRGPIRDQVDTGTNSTPGPSRHRDQFDMKKAAGLSSGFFRFSVSSSNVIESTFDQLSANYSFSTGLPPSSSSCHFSSLSHSPATAIEACSGHVVGT